MRFFYCSKINILLSLLALAALFSTLGLFQVYPAHAAGSADWPTYLHGYNRSGFNGSETIINPTSAPNLKLKWTTKTNGCPNSPNTPLTISTQPVVSQSLQRIFWGSWDGCEHATDLSGHEIWATYIGQTTTFSCTPSDTVGVASTATVTTEMIGGVSTPVILVGGGDANAYALNAITGAVIWKTPLGIPDGSFIWSSPAVYAGSVYMGLSSLFDCPLVQGKVFQINTSTGAIKNTFNVVPNGCTGGSVWGSPTIDQATGTLYFATGNPGPCSQPERYAVALVALNLSNLALKSFWRVPASQQVSDSDFGSTPTLFQAKIGGVVQPMVGVENKNGIYYAFNRTRISNGPVWQATIAHGEIFSPSAWDGRTLYVAGGHAHIPGTSCQGAGGSLRALDPATGNFLWQDCFISGGVLGAVTAVPGVAVVGAGPRIQVVATATGKTLFTSFDPSLDATYYGAASISNGVLYIGDTNGNLYALNP